MTAPSKNVYFDNYNNTFHITITMKPIVVKSNSYAKYNVDSNEKDSKVKAVDHIRILKYKNIFAKGYSPNWSEEFFAISKIKKKTVPWTQLLII